jgi:hypothetical protein
MARTEVNPACNRASNLLFLPSDVQQPRATGTDLRTFLRRDPHLTCDHSRISSQTVEQLDELTAIIREGILSELHPSDQLHSEIKEGTRLQIVNPIPAKFGLVR